MDENNKEEIKDCNEQSNENCDDKKILRVANKIMKERKEVFEVLAND